MGLQLAKILFNAGGKVYIAGRSEEKYIRALKEIRTTKSSESSTAGQVEFLHIELDSLESCRKAAEDFRKRESKLDVLWNNAAVSLPPTGSVTQDGHDLTMGTNCLGPFLFTQLVLPCLKAAAVDKPPATVRVVWSSSIIVDLAASKGGFSPNDLSPLSKNTQWLYTLSKIGNWFLASELGKRVASDGILSVTQNPGNLNSDLTRHLPRIVTVLFQPLLYDAKYGAYTELFAGLSEDLSMEDNGSYIIPWGRKHPAPRQYFQA